MSKVSVEPSTLAGSNSSPAAAPSNQFLIVGAVSIACAFVAVIAVLGRNFHVYQDGDSIMPVLVSLQRWTAFFWEQNRVGMFIPLLALPFRNPFHNLLVQDALNVICFCLTLFVLPAYVLRSRSWILIGALSNAAILLLISPNMRFNAMVTFNYAIPLWGVAALLLIERSDRHRLLALTGAVVLIGVASWINVMAPIFLAALLISTSLTTRRASRFWLSMALVAFSLITGIVWMKMSRYALMTHTQILPLREWPHAWIALLGRSAEKLYEAGPVILLLPLAALAALVLSLIQKKWREPEWQMMLRGSLALIATSVAFWLWIGTLEWTKTNAHHWRYVIPSMMGIAVALATWILLPFCSSRRKLFGRPAVSIAAAIMIAAALFTYGVPSISRAANDVHASCDTVADDVVASGANVLIGGYWKVVPSTYYANLMLYKRGDARRVFLVTDKSEPTRRMWKQIPPAQRVIAAPEGDREVAWFSEHYGIPAFFDRSVGKIDIYRGVPNGTDNISQPLPATLP